MQDFDDLSIRNVERERFEKLCELWGGTREFAIAIGLIAPDKPVPIEYKVLFPHQSADEREAEREEEDRRASERLRERMLADPVYQAILASVRKP